ncbi:MAG TPA: Mut7-C RNAse domain-containing protein [Syntrophorhabdaceae bacterium]|nr:Mut7-C RNAse domain-containing protein [Syntrophorhabdaceae bacterium]
MMFICDTMLGRLSRYLRMLGLDAPCANSPASAGAWEHTGLQPYFFTKRLKAPRYERTVHIRSDRIMEQLAEIRPIIAPHVMPEAVMSRCIECNVPLVATAREDVEHYIPEYIYHHYAGFKQCPSCKKVYWSGSHTEKMKKWIENIITNHQ